MRVAFFGDGPWAHQALRRALAEGFDVRVVVVRDDLRDETLLGIAREHGITGTHAPDVNADGFLALLGSLECELAVSMSFNQILREPIRSLFPRGFLNCHAGKLPAYRGRNILNWALINDEREIGVTCHFVDDGIDTGDIVEQRTFAVTDEDTYGTVLERAITLCPDVLIAAMTAVRDGTARRLPQPREGTYFVARRDGDEWIDWTWSSRRIWTFVRAITTPGPQARTLLRTVDGFHELKIARARLVPDALPYLCAEGAVVGIRDGEPLVKTGDTMVALSAYSIDHPTRRKLRVGDRLGLSAALVQALLSKR